jgi:hypothetical protein
MSPADSSSNPVRVPGPVAVLLGVFVYAAAVCGVFYWLAIA